MQRPIVLLRSLLEINSKYGARCSPRIGVPL
jgi:hypothetical protein